MYEMKKLETFVNEKLKVSKESSIILDTGIYELSSNKEFNAYIRKVDKYLHAFATPAPKNKTNKNILNSDDLYIAIDNKHHMLSVGYKNKETVLFMLSTSNEVMKDDYKGNNTGWRVYDAVFIVPNELKDDVMEIINYEI